MRDPALLQAKKDRKNARRREARLSSSQRSNPSTSQAARPGPSHLPGSGPPQIHMRHLANLEYLGIGMQQGGLFGPSRHEIREQMDHERAIGLMVPSRDGM